MAHPEPTDPDEFDEDEPLDDDDLEEGPPDSPDGAIDKIPRSTSDMDPDPLREREKKRAARKARARAERAELGDEEYERRLELRWEQEADEKHRREQELAKWHMAKYDREHAGDAVDSDDTDDSDDFDDFDDDEPEEPAQAKFTWESWIRNVRIPSSEVALLAGADLLTRTGITSDIQAHLGGTEIVSGKIHFEPKAYLVERFGFEPRLKEGHKFKGPYYMKGASYRLVLHYHKLDPHMTVELPGWRRLVIFFAGGNIDSKGHAEPGILRELAGRAVLWPFSRPGDIRVICVPRTGAFSKAIGRIENRGGAKTYGFHFATADRLSREVRGFRRFVGPRLSDSS